MSFDDEIIYTVFIRDITLRKQHRDALEYQANYDVLTGLPNREFLLRRIREISERYPQSGKGCTLVLLNMNNMQQVNDVLGHDAGDNMLRSIADNLQSLVTQTTLCARIGGDEFGVLFAGHDNLSDIQQYITRLITTIGQPFELEGLPMAASASVGVAAFPMHADSANNLLIAADVAMREARKARRDYMVYQSHFISHTHSNLQLAGDLRRAIEQQEFIFEYQPKVSLSTGELHSFEALVRWLHPEQGRIAPDTFIPMAERSSHIRPFTMMAIERTMQQYRKNLEHGIDVPIAVNIPVSVLENSIFVDELTELLYRYRLPVSTILLEVTETAEIYDHANILQNMRQLKTRGFSLSIDDFGTGNASIGYLKELPAAELKIDREYITDIINSHSDRLITAAVIELAHKLGMRVVAEGIEDAETYHYLANIGCDIAQGFWISRPLQATNIEAWHRDWKDSKAPGLSLISN